MGRFGASSFRADFDVLELGKILRDGRADVELVLFGQDHRGHRGDRLRHGRDAEDGVLLHGRLRGAILIADGVIGDDLAVAHHQQHGAGYALVFDVGLNRLPGLFQAFGREAAVLRAIGHRKRLPERGDANQEVRQNI